MTDTNAVNNLLLLNETTNINKLAGTESENPQIVKDALNRNEVDDNVFENTYGSEALYARDRIAGGFSEIPRQYNQDRDATQLVSDFGVNATNAAVSGLLGLAGYGVAAVDPTKGKDISTGFSKLKQDINQGIGSFTTNSSKKRNNIQSLINQTRKQKREKDYNELNKTNPTYATMRKLGQGFIDGFKSITDNSANVFDTASQGVGSIVGGGVASKLLKVGIPLSTAIQEATSVGSDVQNAILNLDESEFTKSDDYNNLIADRYSPQEAKQVIANDANLVSGFINVIPSLLLQKVFGSSIEKLAPTNIVKDVAGEFAEEATQGVLNKFTGNIVKQNKINPDQSLIEDLGFEGGVGGISGAATAGTISSPTVVKSGAKLASNLVGDAVEDRINNVDNQTKVIDIQQSNNKLKETQSNITEPTENSIDLSVTNVPENIKLNEGNTENYNKVDALIEIDNKLKEDKFESKEDKLDAQLYFAENFNQLVNESTKETDEIEAQEELNSIVNSQELSKRAEDINENIELDLPEGFKLDQKLVEKAIRVAKVNLKKVPDALLSTLFNGSKESLELISKLKPKTIDVLKIKYDNDQLNQVREQEEITLEKTSSYKRLKDVDSNEVSRQANISVGGSKRSVLEYITDVVKLQNNSTVTDKNGEVLTIDNVMTDFKNFAQSMKNKADALYKSSLVDNNDPKNKDVYFDVWDGNSWIKQGNKAFFINGTDESIVTGSRIVSDTNNVINNYNNLVDKFDLGSNYEKIELPNVPKDVQSTTGIKKEVTKTSDNITKDTVSNTNETKDLFGNPVEIKKSKPKRVSRQKTKKSNEVKQKDLLDLIDNKTNREKEVNVSNVVTKKTENKKQKRNNKSKDKNSTVDLTNKTYEESVTLISKELDPKEKKEVDNTREANKKQKDLFGNSATQKVNNDELATKNDVKDYFYKEIFNKLRNSFVSSRFNLSDTAKSLSYFYKEFDLFKTKDKLEKTKKDKLNKLINDNNDLFLTFMNKRVNSVTYGQKGNKLLFAMKNRRSDINLMKQYLSVNLLDKDSDTYNEELLGKAILAFTDWMLNFDMTTKINLDATEFDFDKDKTMYSLLNAKEDLAQNIAKFWGIKPKKNESIVKTRGMIENFAAEMLTVYLMKDENKLFTVKSVKTKKENDLKILVPDVDLLYDLQLGVSNFKELIPAIFSVESGIKFSINEPFTEVSNTQKNNKFGVLSKEGKQLINIAQNIEHKLNTPFLNFITKVGYLAISEAVGSRHSTTRKYNLEDLKTVKGKNSTNRINWNSAYKIANSMIEESDVTGKNIEDISVFFKAEIDKSSRLGFSAGTPQNNKMARTLLVPYRTEIDLSDTKLVNKFWLAIGQGLGVKTEKKYEPEVIEQAQEKVANEYFDLIEAIKDEDYDKVRKLLPNNLSEVALHSIFAVAQFQLAIEGQDESFTSYVSLEADGKTNGIINAIVNFTTGAFTQRFVDLVGKGGYFIGSYNKTLNSHYEVDPDDIYEEVSKKFAQKLSILKSTNKGLVKFIETFGSLSFNENGDIVISRDGVKNPLTITVYGSTNYGLNSKILGGLKKEFQSEITKFLNNESSIFKSVNDIQKTINLVSNQKIDDPVKFNLNTDSFYDQLLYNYTNVLQETISENLGNASENLNLLNEIAKVQQIIAKEVYDSIINSKPIGELTLEDIDKAFEEITNIVPKYKGNGLLLDFTASEFDLTDSKVLSSNMSGKFEGNSSLPTVGEIGVKAKPLSTIGTGDANMMLIAYIQNLVNKNTLPVFDGLEMAITDIESNSKGINEAVYKTWEQNHIKPFLYNFTRFSETLSKENFEKYGAQRIIDKLTEMSNSVEARNIVLGKVTSSIDHMASGSSPYTFEGTIEPTIEAMNEQYYIELEKLNIKEDLIEKTDTSLLENIIWYSHSSSELVVNDIKAMLQGFIIDNVYNKDQTNIVESIINNLPKDFKIIFNDPKTNNLNKVKSKLFPGSEPLTDELGQVDFDNKVIYINNISNETILHELLHAANTYILNTYYTNKKRLNVTQQQAIKSLESLMKDFLNEEFEDNNVVVQNLKSIIRTSLAEKSVEGNIRALGEFQSWVLTNKNLIQQTKTKEISDRTKGIISKAIKLIKKILGLTIDLNSSLYDHVLFNSKVLLKKDKNVNLKSDTSIKLNQNSVSSLVDKLSGPVKMELKDRQRNKVIRDIDTLTNKYITSGFSLNDDQQQKFKQYLGIFNTVAEKNTDFIISGNKVIKLMLDNLSYKDLLPNSKNEKEAKKKFDLLTDVKDINSFGSVIGLYQIDSSFRNLIKSIKIDKKETSFTSLDQFLEDTANTALNKLDIISDDINLDASMTKLNSHLINSNIENSIIHNNVINKTIDNLNSKVVKEVSSISDAIAKRFPKYKAITDPNFNQAFLNFVGQLDIPGFILSASKEIIGKTDLTKDIENLLKPIKAKIQALRQNIKVEMPKIIADQFTREITKQEWNAINNVLGQTDVFNIDVDIISLIKNGNIDSKINELETSIKTKDKNRFKKYIQKSKELALYLSKKETTDNLLTNEDTIARLLNEDEQLDFEPTKELVNDINSLVSLYAYKNSSIEEKNIIKELIKTDIKGLDFLKNLSKELDKIERTKITSNVIRNNRFKGELPFNVKDGVKIIIANDKNSRELILNGYERIGDYKNNVGENNVNKKGYYYSNVVGSGYQQGIIQTINSSVHGIDPISGRTVSGVTAGIITGNYVGRINSRIKANTNTKKGENLRPVFDENNNVIAFERFIKKEMLDKLNNEGEYHKLLASMSGRQEEEKLSEEFNKLLVDESYKLYKEDDKNNYINLATSTDKIHQDSWKVIPSNLKSYIKSVYGEDTFMVRNELVNNVVGYRLASVQDLFTGKTRLPDPVKDVAYNLLKTVFGTKAYKYASVGEKGLQQSVSFAKDLIVVKSGIVPLGNFLSNKAQLFSRGVPIKDIIKYSMRAFKELNQHIKNTNRLIKINTAIAGSKDKKLISKLEKEKNSILTLENNLLIKPLLEAGEFDTIAEGLTDIDDALVNNKWVDWLEKQVDKLPEALKTSVKYGLVTRDTALYKGLNRSVQYGDFIAKYAYYAHLRDNKNQTKKVALEKISEEYVNYSFNPGRERSYLDSIGLTMFWHYKLRIAKVALDLVKNNPVQTLLSNVGVLMTPNELSIGTPFADNIFSSTVDGSIQYNVGWGNMFNSGNLNPWKNIID